MNSECSMSPDPELHDDAAELAPPVIVDAAGLRAAGAQIKRRLVSVPGVGSVYVSGMTAGQAGRIGAMANRGQNDKLQAQIACWCVCGPEGSRMFEDKDMSDMVGWSAEVLKPIAEAAMDLSGFSEEAVIDAQGN